MSSLLFNAISNLYIVLLVGITMRPEVHDAYLETQLRHGGITNCRFYLSDYLPLDISCFKKRKVAIDSNIISNIYNKLIADSLSALPLDLQVYDYSGEKLTIDFSTSGNDYIALTHNMGPNQLYALKFTFPDSIQPINIYPDPSMYRDYSNGVEYAIKYDSNIISRYTITIGNENDSDFEPNVVRGVWVTNVASDVLLSKSGIQECVQLCADLGINTIFMVTYNNGYTMYRSDVMKSYFGHEIDTVYGNRDPLAEMIAEAKLYDIKVVAWFEYGFASVYNDSIGGRILKRYPSWASIDFEGKLTEKNKFYWLDPYNIEVQQFIRKLMTEVVIKYPEIAGVQGDDRLPALPSNGGYNPATVTRYQKETGRTPSLNHLETSWLQWRADKLTDFGTYIYRHVKSIGSHYMMSLSPSPYSWSLENYLQDWPAWLRKGQVDHIHPQLYRYSFEAYKTAFDLNIKLLDNVPKGNLVFSPGVLLGDGSGDGITPQILDQILAYNRSQGIQGETFFYYERIRKNMGFQQTIKKYN